MLLIKFLDEFGEELVGDLREFYHMGMSEFLSLHPVEAVCLVRQIPDGRVTAAQRGGPEFRGWSFDRYLLAALVDGINLNTHYFISANTDPKKKSKIPEPKFVPLPGEAERKKKEAESNPFAIMVNRQMDTLKTNPKEGTPDG